METAEGVIELGSASDYPNGDTFDLNKAGKTPIDVAAVTAILIDGVRVPVPVE